MKRLTFTLLCFTPFLVLCIAGALFKVFHADPPTIGATTIYAVVILATWGIGRWLYSR